MTAARPDVSLLAVVVLVAGCGHVAPAPVMPLRGAIGTDPSTTAGGTVECEAGILAGDDEHVDVPVLIKWGATDATEVYAGWSPYLRLATRRGIEDGYGDVVLGSRIRFHDESDRAPAAAFELFTRLPVARNEVLSTGLVDVFVAASVSKVFERTTLVGYYQLGVLSDPDSSDTLEEHTVSTSASRTIHGPLQGYAELAGVFTPAQSAEALLLVLGVGVDVHANVGLDAEAYVGLTGDAEAYAFALGFTANVGSLF